MALVLPLVVFVGATTLSAAVIVGGVTMTTDAISKAIATAPRPAVVTPDGYVRHLQPRQAIELDVARSVPVVPAGAQPGSPFAQAEFTHTVDADSLRVRSGPAKTTGELFLLKRGARVTVSGNEGKWLMVRTEDGRSGWAFGGYLKPLDGTTTTAAN